MSDDLLDAIQRGDAERTRLLLQGGADPHEDSWGFRPIDEAVERRDVRIARLLVEHGARLAVRDEHGRTRLHAAASGADDPQLVELLLDLGMDPNEADDAGWTALHYAAAYGHREVTARLLNAGALPTATTNNAKLPADLARANGHVWDD